MFHRKKGPVQEPIVVYLSSGRRLCFYSFKTAKDLFQEITKAKRANKWLELENESNMLLIDPSHIIEIIEPKQNI